MILKDVNCPQSWLIEFELYIGQELSSQGYFMGKKGEIAALHVTEWP